MVASGPTRGAASKLTAPRASARKKPAYASSLPAGTSGQISARRALVEDLLARARALKTENLSLEVRVSNFAAQALYRTHGFRLAGLRRGYYRDTGEDALVMEWRPKGA